MRGWLVVLCLCLGPVTQAYFGDDWENEWASTVQKMRGYFVQIKPFLAQGLQLAKRAEEFLDSTLAEECPEAVECHRGLSPQPRRGHRPSSNGCGSLDVMFDDTDASFIHLERAFTDCCNEHDLCYDTCNEDKDVCDVLFRKCLYRTCKGREKGYLDVQKCKVKAKLAFLTVMGVGCQSYRDAQREACVCARDDLKLEHVHKHEDVNRRDEL